MKFAEKAMELRELRKSTGISEKPTLTPVTCFLESEDGKLVEMEEAFLVYKPVEITDETSDAQLVRAGTWSKDECGMLHVINPIHSIQIARVNPKEQVDLAIGWITEKGEIIIRKGL